MIQFHKDLLKDFIENHWVEFLGHVQDMTGEDDEKTAMEILDALEE